MPFVLFDSE